MLDKIKKFFIGLILAALALTSCTRAIPAGNSSLDKGSKSSKSLFESLFKSASTPTPPGDYVLTLDIKKEEIKDARTRTYNLHIPSGYDPKTPTGLLILFPADGQIAREFLKETKFQSFSDNKGFILVVPDQYSQGMKWNNGVSKTDGPDDKLFISTLLAELKDTLNIDPKRIVVSGKAEGGIMAYQIATIMADQIAAVGVYGASIGYRASDGAEPVKISSPTAPVSVIAIHGLRDRNIPAASPARSAGYLSMDDMEGFWINALACPGPMKAKQLKNENILRHNWSGCANNTEVQTYTIWLGDSDWATGTATHKNKNVDIPATQIIWEFIYNHPKN